VNYWRRAVALAVSRSAIAETIAHVRHGLELLATLPDDRKRQKTELELRLILAGALPKSWNSLDVQREYERARDLARQIGDQDGLIQAAYGIWVGQFMRDDLSLTVCTAQELLRAADTHNNVAARCIGHCCTGITSFQEAAFSIAREHFEKALILDDLEQARNVYYLTGHDVGVQILSFFSRTLAVLGFLQQARSRRDELLVRGRALSHTQSRAQSYVGAFITSLLIGDKAGQASAVENLLRILAEDRFPYYLAVSEIYSG
jgi:predicted ATPase